MNAILRNIIVTIVAIALGMLLNSAIVQISVWYGPLPNGVIRGNMNSVLDHIDSFDPIHFALPFLAHALGTLLAAFIVAKFVTTKNMVFALSMGGFFLLGGIANASMIKPPMWFVIFDVLLAYVPMGWLGWKLAGSK